MGQNWFYAQGNEQVGPVESDQLRAMLADGRLSGSALVWSEGMPAWVAAQSVPEFAVLPSIQPGAVASLPYYTPQVQYQYAGFWLRFVAWILDSLILVIPSGIVRGIIMGVMSAAGAPPAATFAVGYMAQLAVGWLYFALQESSVHQATLGKRALSLKVMDLNGNRLTFDRASGRYFGKLVSGIILAIGYMMAGWTQRKQALHDMMAGCLVMRTA